MGLMNLTNSVNSAPLEQLPGHARAYRHWARVPLFLRLWLEQRISNRTPLGQFLRRWRRFILGTFYPDFVKEGVANMRTGDCHRCGLCCQLIYKCPFLGRDGQNLPYCRIYGDLRPANCHSYPFDRIDAEVDTCGFKFEPQVKP